MIYDLISSNVISSVFFPNVDSKSLFENLMSKNLLINGSNSECTLCHFTFIILKFLGIFAGAFQLAQNWNNALKATASDLIVKWSFLLKTFIKLTNLSLLSNISLPLVKSNPTLIILNVFDFSSKIELIE